jgi:hypothetical protein
MPPWVRGGFGPYYDDSEAPSAAQNEIFCYRQTVMGLLLWRSLSDEKTGLSYTLAAGLRQLSHSRIRIPRD